MPVKITYFVHSTTIDNERNISSGWFDVEISKLGIQQSIDLSNKIKDKYFDAVFSSDLKRASHSAKLIFPLTTKIIEDSRLRECNYGSYNGKPSSIVEPLQEKNIMRNFPQGESYKDVENRINNFLSFLRTNYNNQSVAIVSHKAPQLALDVIIKGVKWEDAFNNDWRKTKSWKPGREYILE